MIICTQVRASEYGLKIENPMILIFRLGHFILTEKDIIWICSSLRSSCGISLLATAYEGILHADSCGGCKIKV